jgi:CHAD domain-containing protein
MAHANHSAHPITTLRETAASLEAAILLCVAKPRKSAIHRLRTLTRRIEAQLELLDMLPGLPLHQEQARKARSLLKELRHAAGQVRDFDVQRDLIRDEAARSTGAPRTGREQDRDLREQARHLRRALHHKRDEAEDHLLRLLRKRATQLTLVFEELLDTLAPAESFTLSEAQLTTLVRDWYTNHREPHTAAPVSQHAAELHEMRKRAKLARYLAESAPESATAAHRLAARFEKLQQAGGEWHDWLILSEVAAHKLGDSAQLPQRFAAHANHALRTFKRRLRYKM